MIFISQRAVQCRSHSQPPPVSDNTDVSGSSLQSPCWHVTLLVTKKWKQSSQWKWKQKIYWAESRSANTWAHTAQTILLCLWCPLLCWTPQVQHLSLRALSAKLCGTPSKVILSRFPINSVGNNLLKLRVLGLILVAYIVEFWKAHNVCCPHLFTWMHVEFLKNNVIFSVGGRRFYATGTKTSMSNFWSRDSKSEPALPKTRKGMTPGSQIFGFELGARKRVAVPGEWAEIHGEKSVNLLCLCGCL